MFSNPQILFFFLCSPLLVSFMFQIIPNRFHSKSGFEAFVPILLLAAVFFGTFTCCLGNDTAGFKSILSRLCSLNKEGAFGSCCLTHPIESVSLENKNTWDCFVTDLKTEDGLNITLLFVFFQYSSHNTSQNSFQGFLGYGHDHPC